MREPREILGRARALLAAGEPAERAALATVVAVEGSSYRREGARMLLEADGRATGVLSGGCVERELVRAAGEVAASGAPRAVSFDLTAEGEAVWGYGTGCAGRVTLLVEPLRGRAGAALERAFSAVLEARRSLRLATVFAASDPSVPLGERLFFDDRDETRGSPAARDGAGGRRTGAGRDRDGGAEPPRGAAWWERELRAGLAGLAPGAARAARIAGPGGARVAALLEALAPPVKLVVVGAERDVVPLARLGAELGWEVAVADPRPTEAARARFAGLARYCGVAPRGFRSEPALALDARSAVVLATHRYLDDLAVLGELAAAPCAYLGLLGPAARRRRLLHDLARRGIAFEAARLRGPAGLALGGRAPEEVALAIAAEIQAALHGGSGAPLARAAEARPAGAALAAR